MVDAAPVLAVSDARGLAGASDLTIVMVKMGTSRRSELAAALQNLRKAGTRSLALVLVGVKPETSAYYQESDRKDKASVGHSYPSPIRSVPERPIAVAAATKASSTRRKGTSRKGTSILTGDGDNNDSPAPRRPRKPEADSTSGDLSKGRKPAKGRSAHPTVSKGKRAGPLSS